LHAVRGLAPHGTSRKKARQTWQRAILLLLVATMFANMMPAAAFAQTGGVTMSKDQWGKTIWMADWMQRNQGHERVKNTYARKKR
jgi:hypothetical protein